jgi:hypothetical protein
MATKRRTAGVQRRGRASDAAMNRRLNQRSGALPIDWRLLLVGGVLVIGLIIFVVVLTFGGATGPRVGTQMPDEGAGHVDQSTFPTYVSRPATSGQHWNLGDGVAPLFWGVYTSPVAEPAAVHNLEHGGIVIWYQDTATAEDIQKLTQFVQQAQAGSNFKVLLSPWAGEDFGHPIAVTAWDWMLYLDTTDIDQIRAFQDDHPPTDAPEPAGGPAQGSG